MGDGVGVLVGSAGGEVRVGVGVIVGGTVSEGTGVCVVVGRNVRVGVGVAFGSVVGVPVGSMISIHSSI